MTTLLEKASSLADEPPKLWVTIWEVFAPYCLPNEPGIYRSNETYPSREVADQAALNDLATLPPGFEAGIVYLWPEPA